MVDVDELGVYQAVQEAGALHVRVRPLLRVPNDLGADAAIALLEGLGVHSGFGDDGLRLWGLKLVLDGGVLGAAMNEPYASDPANRAPTTGAINWGDAISASAQLRGLSGHTLWPSR
jgi:hypothetical protein